jgi:hypothetical protein
MDPQRQISLELVLKFLMRNIKNDRHDLRIDSIHFL